MQDWKIELTINRQKDFDNRNTIGSITVNHEYKSAKVRILDSLDCDYEKNNPSETLAHEMIELMLSTFINMESPEVTEIARLTKEFVANQLGNVIFKVKESFYEAK